MRKGKVESRILIFAGLLVLFAILAIVPLSPSVAYGVLSPTYVQSVQESGLEWWSELLALDEVKQIVDGWFLPESKMYDFSLLDDDPIVVAVIDSGIDLTHEAFTGASSSSGVGENDVLYRNSRGSVIGKNTVADNSNVSDVSGGGHGTHVAGIVAALIHWLGLEKYIKIMPIMAGKPSGNSASFTSTDVKEGIEFALANGADVINLSLESTDRDFNFVTPEWAERAIFVAAAGNGRTVGGKKVGYDSAKQPCYPAADERVIGVMNISNERDSDGGLVLSESSNYGDAYDLCAPGSMIYSASKSDAEQKYIAKSGTSMATPMVSFASALALLKFRAIEQATGVKKSVDDVREIVKFSSTTYLDKGDYDLSVLNLKKIAISDNDVLARVDMESVYEKQTLGEIKPIPVALHVFPESLQGQGNVEWHIDDPENDVVAEGFEYVYTPKNERGKQAIYAVWKVEYNGQPYEVVVRHTISVDYARITAQTMSALRVGVLIEDGSIKDKVPFEKGKTYTLTFDGVQNYDPDVVEDFKWLNKDGEIVASGGYYAFTPPDDGYYEFSLRLGTRNSQIFKIGFVVGTGVTKDDILRYVTYAAVAAIVLAIAAILVATFVKRKRAK